MPIKDWARNLSDWEAACGTESGYKRHRRLGEQACRPCLDATAAEVRRRRHMPAVPESPEGFARRWLSEPLSAFVFPDELAAIELVKDSARVDAVRTFQFWEAMIARLTGGTTTDHKCGWDVELPYVWGPIRIEVKYAQEVMCTFQQGVRPIFKWAAPKGVTKEKTAHVLVLVGVEPDNTVNTWVLPGREVRKCASITLTSPRVRTSFSISRGVDDYRCPPTQLLPEVLHAYRSHLSYDAEQHASTRARNRQAAETQGMDALFGIEGAADAP